MRDRFLASLEDPAEERVAPPHQERDATPGQASAEPTATSPNVDAATMALMAAMTTIEQA